MWLIPVASQDEKHRAETQEKPHRQEAETAQTREDVAGILHHAMAVQPIARKPGAKRGTVARVQDDEKERK